MRRFLPLHFVLITLTAGGGLFAAEDRSPRNHRIHDEDRQQPPVVDPGAAGPPAPAPSDAIVLFDGSGLDAWRAKEGAEPEWKISDGNLQVVPGAGDIQTDRTFGDIQLHVEFRTDPESSGSGQHRSNSGVFFGPYEIQILDSHENKTYPDGMAAAIYGQYPPLVNASRPAGQWQTLDIVYRAPEFDEDGEVTSPTRITIFHNGVLVQDNEELIGPTSHILRRSYQAHGDVPIILQDHRDDPVEFRNIWVRELK